MQSAQRNAQVFFNNNLLLLSFFAAFASRLEAPTVGCENSLCLFLIGRVGRVLNIILNIYLGLTLGLTAFGLWHLTQRGSVVISSFCPCAFRSAVGPWHWKQSLNSSASCMRTILGFLLWHSVQAFAGVAYRGMTASMARIERQKSVFMLG